MTRPAHEAPHTVPSAELMAYRLVSQSIEHGMIHVECSLDPTHACVCTWTERFIEHAAALFDEYARQQGAPLP